MLFTFASFTSRALGEWNARQHTFSCTHPSSGVLGVESTPQFLPLGGWIFCSLWVGLTCRVRVRMCKQYTFYCEPSVRVARSRALQRELGLRRRRTNGDGDGDAFGGRSVIHTQCVRCVRRAGVVFVWSVGRSVGRSFSISSFGVRLFSGLDDDAFVVWCVCGNGRGNGARKRRG